MIDFRNEYKKANEQIAPDPVRLAALYDRLSAETNKCPERNSFLAVFARPMRIIAVAACAVLVVGAAIALPNLVGVKNAADYSGESPADRSTVISTESTPADYVNDSLFADEAQNADQLTAGNEPSESSTYSAQENGIPNGAFADEIFDSETALGVDEYMYLENAIYVYQYIFRPLDYGNVIPADSLLPADVTCQFSDCAFYLVNDDNLTALSNVNNLLLTCFSEDCVSELKKIAPASYFEYGGRLFTAVKTTATVFDGTVKVTGFLPADSGITYYFSCEKGDGSVTMTYDPSADTMTVSGFTLPEIIFNATAISIG